MKKNLFLIGLAAIGMLFASCSNDETVEVAKNQNGIQFKSFVNNSTRATDLTTANLTDFQVWGIMKKDNQIGKPFVGTQVSKPGGAWSYGTPVYWEKGYQYSFVAVAPAGVFEMVEAPADYQDYGRVKFDNGSGDTDLLWATNDKGLVTWEGDVCPAAVDLTFNHMLSRVRFNFVNAMDDGSLLTVKDVTITNACTVGTVALIDDNAGLAWAAIGNAALLFDDAAETGFAQNAACTTGHKYMIPTTKAYNVTFKVERAHNGVVDTYEHSVNLTEMEMESGKSYQFKAEFTAQNINPDGALCPIVFEPTVNEWDAWGDAIDMNM
mgnify:FL=1